MHRLILIALMFPAVVWGAAATINADGDFLTQSTCQSGAGRAEVYAGGGNGYGSGTVTFEYYSTATGVYETVCPTAADCQWTTGDSGAVPFDLGAPATLQFNMTGSTSPTVPVAIVCK